MPESQPDRPEPGAAEGGLRLPVDSAALTEAAAEALGRAAGKRVILEDFRPMAESLDWKLGAMYWRRTDSRAWLSESIPFAVTSDGWLSRGAVEVLFAALAEAEGSEASGRTIRVLEVGVGLGLFARYFLDAFRERCRHAGKDYYDRLTYVGTDLSESVLKDLRERGVLDAHEGRYELRVGDALRLDDLAADDGQPYHAIILNYLLDTLPAAVLRSEESGLSQLWVRTGLARGVSLSAFTSLSQDEVVQRVRSGDPKELAELIDLYKVFSLEYEFRPVELESLPHSSFVAGMVKQPGQFLVYSYGAVECLASALKLLRRGGVILLSDYGQVDDPSSGEMSEHQHFGPSTAIGLNFPLLGAYFEKAGRHWLRPNGDGTRIYTRALGWRLSDAVVAEFHERFDKKAYDRAQQPLDEARQLLEQGHHGAAMEALREAVRRQGANWALLEEIARYLIFVTGDYEQGVDIAEMGLTLNPISPHLWNTYGEGLYYLGHRRESHFAFTKALECNPRDPRACLGLAYTFAEFGDPSAALRMVAEGLACDDDGAHQEGLLEQQSRILMALSQRRQLEQQYLATRSRRIAARAKEDPAPPAAQPAAGKRRRRRKSPKTASQ